MGGRFLKGTRMRTMKHKTSEKSSSAHSVPASAKPGMPVWALLKLAAIVIVPVGLLFGMTYLWDFIWPSSDPLAKLEALAKEDKTPPKLNPNTPPGPGPGTRPGWCRGCR